MKISYFIWSDTGQILHEGEALFGTEEWERNRKSACKAGLLAHRIRENLVEELKQFDVEYHDPAKE